MARPNEYTPYGSRTWNQTGSYNVGGTPGTPGSPNSILNLDEAGNPYYTGGMPATPGTPGTNIPLWESREQFTPLGQERFDQEQRIIGSLGNTAEAGLGRVGESQSQPFDLSQVGARPDLPTPMSGGGQMPGITQIPNQSDIADRLYSQQTRYLDPQYQKQELGLENRLVNQGLQRGTEAFKSAMGDFGQTRDMAYADARDRAILAAGQEQSRQFGLGTEQFGQGAARFGMGLAGQGQQFGQEADAFRLGMGGRQQDIGEQAYLRGLPLNELNALRTGSQVQGPQFQNFASSGAQPAPIAQASQLAGDYTTDAFNLKNAQRGQTMGTVGAVGGAVAAAFI